MDNEQSGEGGGGGAAGDGEIPEIELIIRASTIDGRRKGACLFCQVVNKIYYTAIQYQQLNFCRVKLKRYYKLEYSKYSYPTNNLNP